MTISNERLLSYALKCQEQNPELFSAIVNSINSLGPALSKATLAGYPKFFSKALELCPDKRLIKRTLKVLKSNHCPVCGYNMQMPGASGCSNSCARRNPKVAEAQLAGYLAAVKTRTRDSKAVVSNTGLLDYVQDYKKRCPNRLSRLVSALTGQTRSHAFPKWIKEIAPVFLEKSISLVSGNFVLAKQTIITERSNHCPVCNSVTGRPGGHCSNSCVGKDPAVKASKARTLLKNYGVEYPSRSPELRRRAQQTMLRIHGVTHALKSEALKSKYRDTMLERHGVSHSAYSVEIQDKAKATMLTKYEGLGMGHPTIQAKVQETSMRNHGYRHPSQSPIVRARQARGKNKNKYKRKVFVEANGRIHDTVQGYEPSVLAWFNSIGVNNFVTDPEKMPNIRIGRSYYLPDARFKHKGKMYLLEVKSDYTLLDQWRKNLRKFRYANTWCENNGYTFLLAISNGKEGKPTLVLTPTPGNVKQALAKFWTLLPQASF